MKQLIENRSSFTATRCRSVRRGLGLALIGLLPAMAGCLNPEFVNQLKVPLPFTTSQLYPLAPGDEPFLLVRLINDTSSSIDVDISYDNGAADLTYRVTRLDPGGRETGILLDWPVTRLALGDLDSPNSPAIVASIVDAEGVVSGVNAVAFGRPALVAGVDYGRGDTIIFHLTDDGRSPAFISVSIAVSSSSMTSKGLLKPGISQS